jgi:DNA-binding transcriptional regulator YiaG
MSDDNIIDLSTRRNRLQYNQAKMLARLKSEQEAKQSPRVQAERLIWAREMYGFSQADWAEIVGVSLEDVEAWEEGKSEPTAEHLHTLEFLTDFTSAWFCQPVSDAWPGIDQTTLRFH